ncbi:MAG: hypothetical protein G01um101472_471 [Parcubacteria group bacterium Gr01-1014_72]|nr:MAG: hypothetical protein G01um101472_471 [Parcubacteria group bacterium Gr01-1014_72]
MIRLKRICDKASKTDGFRVLVDRLWPRGTSKEKAALDLWLKDIAPSAVLRKWFGHDPGKWGAFQKRYKSEISRNKEIFNQLKKISRNKVVTLLYAAKDKEHNEAVVLKDLLEIGRHRKT